MKKRLQFSAKTFLENIEEKDKEQVHERPLPSEATAPNEPDETPPARVYVPKVSYPVPTIHLMGHISTEQLAGFKKMVIRLPKKI